MQPMLVVTAKRDGGTQDVVGFYPTDGQGMYDAICKSRAFLEESKNSRRAIVRIELYNPQGSPIQEKS